MSEQITGTKAWDAVCAFVNNDGRFKTSTGIVFESRVSGNRIFYKGGKTNGGLEEDLNRDEFIAAFDLIPVNSAITTNSIRGIVPPNIHKKLMAFVTLLRSAGVLNT
jgi:hypothetical protein